MSALGTAFPGVAWDDYVTALETKARDAQIAVVGVTDYMSIDGYEKLLSAKIDAITPRLQSVDLLIPNIEFRALPATGANKALNIHLLVDPSDPDHIEKIRRALRNLRVQYGEETYGCIRAELIEFGKKQKPELANDDEAYKYGIQQFKPSYETIAKWLSTEGWLKSNSLRGIANGNDGISGLPLDGFSATRDELLRLSRFVFSGSQKDREHYLGRKKGIPVEEIVRLYGSRKPCLHGSDAHSIDKLFVPDLDRYCWIKADPTYEGLKQVLWEPEARVAIGATKPQQTDQSRIITKLQIKNPLGWFVQAEIPLNSGLVAVIGEKGSGKTAIADLISFSAAAEVSTESQSSFIAKGRLHLEGVQVSLTWGAGAVTDAVLATRPYKAPRPLVRYLSQDFVERLCATDHEGQELQQAIEEVVFGYLDEKSREGYSSFAELRMSREAASQVRQDAVRGQLAAAHREIERIIVAIGQAPAKAELKKQVQSQIEELKKQLPEATTLADKSVLEKIEQEKSQLSAIEDQINQKSRQRRSLDEALKSFRALRERTTKLVDDLVQATNVSAYLKEDVLKEFHPKWSSNLEGTIEKMVSDLEAEIVKLQGVPDTVAVDENSVVARGARIQKLQDSLSKDELNRKRLIDLQKQIGDQEAVVQRLDKELEELKTKVAKQFTTKHLERTELYLDSFAALSEDSKGLKELYAPMKKQLVKLGAETQFELSAGYRVDVRAWLEKATRFFDGRKPAATARKDEIEKFAFDTLAPAWRSGDKERVRVAFQGLYELVGAIKFMEELAAPSVKLIDLFDWMYSTDHVTTSYKILYGGTELEYLSPGTRGIALLVLYLLMDEDDRRPLLIDQPEGNLDNASIYAQLVPYIRAAKEKRQIILVTHNPNLVVATDAEQVIVASADRPATQSFPQIHYFSGSLEHTQAGAEVGTRQAVCLLLEGGEDAFKAREERYAIRD